MPQATAVIRASDGARSAVESSASEGESTDASEAGPSAQRGRDSGRLLRRGLAPPAHGPICRGPQRLPAGHDSPLLATELIRSRSRTAMPASRQASVQSSVHEPSMAVDAAPTSGLGRVPWKRPQPSTGLPRSPGVPHRVPLPPGLPASYLSQGSACAMARVARSPGSAGARRRSAPAPAPAPRVAVQPGTALPLPRGHTPRAQAVGLMLRRAACGYTRGLSQGQWGAEVLADAFAVLPSGDDALVLARLFHRILARPGAGAGAWRAAAIAFATAPDPAGVDRGKEGDDEWMQPLEQSEAVALVESLAPEPGNAVPAAAVAAALLEPALVQARCRPSESAVLAALEGAEASEGVSPTPGALARLAVARLVHDAGAAHHLLQLLLRGPALLSWPALATLAALSAAAPPSPPVPPATPVPSLHGDGAQRPAATPRAHTADSSCVGASSSEHAVVGAPNSAPQGEEEEEAEAEAGSGRTAAQDPCLARLRAAWRRLCTGEGRGAGRMPSPASSAARGPGRSATSSYSTRRRSRPATVSRLSGSTGQGPAGAARTGSASGSTTLRRIRSAQRTARAARAVGLASASVASTFRDMTAQDSGAAARRSPPRTRPVAQRVAEERAGRSGGGGGDGVATPLCRRRRTSASATRAPRRSPSRASVGRGGALRGRDRAHTPGQAGAAQRLERARPQSAASARPSVPTALSEALCGAGGQGRERAPGGPRSASPTAQRGPPAKGGGEEGGGGGGSDPWPLSSSSRLARGKLRLPTQRCALCEYPFPRGAMYGQTLLSAVLRVRTEWGYPCDVAVPPWASCSVLPLCAMCTAIRDGALKREEARQRAARAQEASRRRVLKARLEARRRRMLEALDQDQGGPLSAQADAARTRPSPMRSPAQSVGPEPAVDDSSDPCGGGGSAGEVTLPEPRGSGALELPQPEQERDGCGGGEPCREAECCAKSTGEGVGGYDLEAIPHSQQGGATPEVAALRPRQEPVSPPSISQATWHDEVSESSVQVPRDMALGVDVPRAEACLQSAEPVVDDDLRHELQAFRVSLLDKKDRLLQRRCAAFVLTAQRLLTAQLRRPTLLSQGSSATEEGAAHPGSHSAHGSATRRERWCSPLSLGPHTPFAALRQIPSVNPHRLAFTAGHDSPRESRV